VGQKTIQPVPEYDFTSARPVGPSRSRVFGSLTPLLTTWRRSNSRGRSPRPWMRLSARARYKLKGIRWPSIRHHARSESSNPFRNAWAMICRSENALMEQTFACCWGRDLARGLVALCALFHSERLVVIPGPRIRTPPRDVMMQEELEYPSVTSSVRAGSPSVHAATGRILRA